MKKKALIICVLSVVAMFALGDNRRLFDEGCYTTPVEVAARHPCELDTNGHRHPMQDHGGSISFAEDND